MGGKGILTLINRIFSALIIFPITFQDPNGTNDYVEQYIEDIKLARGGGGGGAYHPK